MLQFQMDRKQVRAIRSINAQSQVVFWLSILLSYTVIQLFKDGNDQSFFLVFGQNLKRLPAMLFAAYTFNDIIIPFLFRKRRYPLFLLCTLLLFYAASALDRVVNVYVYEPLFRKDDFEQESLVEIFTHIDYLFSAYLPPLLVAVVALSLITVTIEKNRYERQNLKLERDKNRAELNVLKAQIHPHFLFNTLNNLYALTVQKSDNAPKMVESLSSMLDYILYRCNDRLVSLADEVQLVKDYISLEQLRYGEEIAIVFDVDLEKAADQSTQIAPLLLLSIVENTFKHGVSNQTEGLEIEMHFSVVAHEVLFVAKNTKSAEKQVDEMNYTKGIGISNVKQQLQLLYGDSHFHQTDLGNWYIVELRINTLSFYA